MSCPNCPCQHCRPVSMPPRQPHISTGATSFPQRMQLCGCEIGRTCMNVACPHLIQVRS